MHRHCSTATVILPLGRERPDEYVKHGGVTESRSEVLRIVDYDEELTVYSKTLTMNDFLKTIGINAHYLLSSTLQMEL